MTMDSREKTIVGVGNTSEQIHLADSDAYAMEESSSFQVSSDILDSIGNLMRSKAKLKYDDLLVKLRNVIQDNLELKDNVAQSNLALKQQMNLLRQWIQQVSFLQHRHTQELDDGKKLSETISQENLALKATIMSCQSGCCGAGFNDLDAFIKKLRDELEKSEHRLRATLRDNETLITLRTKLDGDVTLLKSELATRRCDYEKLNLQKQSLESTLLELRTKLNAKDSVLEKENDDCVQLEKLLIDSSETNCSLSDQLRSSKHQFRQVNGSKEEENARSLQKEIRRLKKELSETKGRSELNQISDHFYEAKIKSIQELHDGATAKIISYEELLGARNDEIARLKKDLGQAKAKLRETNSESETIAVLRAQIEIYQGDFRAERESREAMANERESLREEIKNLQLRNTQLTDELESYQRREFDQRTDLSRE